MALLIASDLNKDMAGQPLLRGVSFKLERRERMTIAGRNGAGKTTLLRMLAGETSIDRGELSVAKGVRIALHDQRPPRERAIPLREYLLSGCAEELQIEAELSELETKMAAGTADEAMLTRYAGAQARLEARGGYLWRNRATAMAHGLGFAEADLDRPLDTFSGGQLTRASLARALATGADVLLLDEPTNHLDIEAIDWLGRHLRDRTENGRGAVIVVSHDRWLLDTVCERTWEVDRGQVHSAEGGYSAYVLAQAERERGEEAAERRRRNLARKELAWLQRGARARSTKAKFRVEAANALIAAEPPARDSVELTRLATVRLGKTVIELEDVSVAVPADGGLRRLLEHVTWQLGPGERVGITGVNGSGKTSLLNLLAETSGPGLVAEGTVVRGKTVRLAYLSQELAELDPDQRVREAVEEVRLRIRIGDREVSAGQLLERLGFSTERQWTRIGDLSGGERRRVQLLRLLMDEPNVLLLDEPTNDLDIETLTEFEDLLDGWPGTLVVVSHDRYFLERVTEHVMALLGDGRLSFLGGGVDEYLDRIRAARAGSTGGPTPPPAAPSVPKSSAAEERTARKELQRLERQLDRLKVRETELTALLAANATDYEKLTALGAELRAVQTEKSDLEDRWLTIAAEFE